MKSSAYILQYQLANVIIDTLKELQKKGYTLEFRRECACIYCFEWQQWILPANFIVDEFYHFEEPQAPDADRIIYAISLSQGGKGFLIDTCSVYMDNISNEMLQRLSGVQISKDDFLNNGSEKKSLELVTEFIDK